ncbi:hypothetical protein J5N97_011982 [Dioscorea zingiberensis]|uniref:Uncharacterized protein n=1 Tax=Dioscorea zingiberensis TaxID=325984 RepID=A0A9D5D3Q5_9LILI|nr:hypothetical protein J5N97_011982 [Dioscorea zingiberensis]
MEEERSRLPRRGYTLSSSIPSHGPSDSVYLGPVIFENQLIGAIDADVDELHGAVEHESHESHYDGKQQNGTVDLPEKFSKVGSCNYSDIKRRKHQLYGICLTHWLSSLLFQGSCSSVCMEMYKGSDRLMTETCMMPGTGLNPQLASTPPL